MNSTYNSYNNSYNNSYKYRVKQIESDNNYNAYNRRSGASGAYQFIPSTWKSIMGNAPMTPENQDTAFDRLTNINYNGLKKNLGREPVDGELYLAHQQGLGGAIKILNANASSPLEPEQLSNNPFNANTIGEWRQGWLNKFNGTNYNLNNNSDKYNFINNNNITNLEDYDKLDKLDKINKINKDKLYKEDLLNSALSDLDLEEYNG